MPKLKASPGKIQLKTPIMDEFQRWLCYELVNAQNWNKDLITGGMNGIGKWKFSLQGHWTIEFRNNTVHVTSDEPVVVIRQGLTIRMGDGKLELR